MARQVMNANVRQIFIDFTRYEAACLLWQHGAQVAKSARRGNQEQPFERALFSILANKKGYFAG